MLDVLIRNPQEFSTEGNSSDSDEYFKLPSTSAADDDDEDTESLQNAIERLQVEAAAAQSSSAKLEQRNKKNTKREFTQYISLVRQVFILSFFYSLESSRAHPKYPNLGASAELSRTVEKKSS